MKNEVSESPLILQCALLHPAEYVVPIEDAAKEYTKKGDESCIDVATPTVDEENGHCQGDKVLVYPFIYVKGCLLKRSVLLQLVDLWALCILCWFLFLLFIQIYHLSWFFYLLDIFILFDLFFLLLYVLVLIVIIYCKLDIFIFYWFFMIFRIFYFLVLWFILVCFFSLFYIRLIFILFNDFLARFFSFDFI
jgi:hypothetical protein